MGEPRVEDVGMGLGEGVHARGEVSEPGSAEAAGASPARRSSAKPQNWLSWVQSSTEAALAELLSAPGEAALDPRWAQTLSMLRAYVARPAKRVRPFLVFAGYAFGRGYAAAPAGLMHFAAGIELLHTFMLIHDDVADQAATRRGGPALHLQLGRGKVGEDLAVVAGDHVFARSLEAMLESRMERAPEVVRYYLSVCRQTAVGQFLDIDSTQAPLSNITLFQTLKVAHLKTARYGFAAPMVCGAMLAGADAKRVALLERVGRHIGSAYQLVDDLIGLYGDPRVSGKPADADFAQGKRTFPVIAAYTRATEAGRSELEALWNKPYKTAEDLRRAQNLVDEFGGRAATLRVVDRVTRRARRAMAALPEAGGVRDILDDLVAKLAYRSA